MDSSNAATTWTRPLSIWLAPALILVLGVLTILFDPFGIEVVPEQPAFSMPISAMPRALSTTAEWCGCWNCPRWTKTAWSRSPAL